jgi:putative salt-induced outer membrane protein YdiY
MMNKAKAFTLAPLAPLAWALLLAPAYAEDAAAEAPVSYPLWSGSAEVGSVWTSGNTDTSSINGTASIKREAQVWESKLRFDALTSEEDNKTTKEKYKGLGQVNYDFTERLYLATVAWQERDRFSGFDYQGSASAGLGYRLIDSEYTKLQLEAGPGYSRERETATQEVIEDRIGRFVLNYSWLIREGIEFTETATAEKGDKNGIYTSETGFKSQINGSIATKLTYKIKSVDEVPVGKKHTDREFGVTLVLSF